MDDEKKRQEEAAVMNTVAKLFGELVKSNAEFGEWIIDIKDEEIKLLKKVLIESNQYIEYVHQCIELHAIPRPEDYWKKHIYKRGY